MKRVTIVLVLMLQLLDKSAKANEMDKHQTVQRYDFNVRKTQQVNYLLYLPNSYEEDSKKAWPVVLFLHGAGERGTNIWKVATHGPPKLVREGREFPFILISPQCPEGSTWSREVLLGLLDFVCKEHRVDTNRLYVTGLSMGGYGAWDLGLSHPEKFAAIAPICGGGDYITGLLSSRDRANAIKTLGVWAFHGAKDPVVPLSESQRMVDLLKKHGAQDVKLTIYPEAEHNSWTQAYDDPELYRWMLGHRRGK